MTRKMSKQEKNKWIMRGLCIVLAAAMLVSVLVAIFLR